MHRRFRAVIFDLDGLLADSEPWWNQIDAKLLAEYGVAYRGEHHRNVLGVSYRLATEFFANRVDLFPSAKATLERLREMKLFLALATSSVSASARPFLERTGIERFFDVIVTGDEIERGKPHPDIYLLAAKKLGVPADACLVIEDALSGVAAARAANMRVAAIPDTRFVDPREYKKEADHVFRDLSEVSAFVDRVNAAAGKD
jgi:HAD superfamily hydrolase (TIGR01509 family)